MTRLSLKIIAVFLITVVLLIPLTLIRGLIAERSNYRDEARRDIARSWTGEQQLIGPILVVPVLAQAATAEGRRHLLVLPENLSIQANVRTEERRRGIYSVPVYRTRLELTGEFDLAEANPPGNHGWKDFDLEAAAVAVSFSDNRGISGDPSLLWDDAPLKLAAGSTLTQGQGVHAPVGRLDPEERTRIPFHLQIELRGMEALRFAPVGRETRVVMKAGWPHPSFVGRFLPSEYEVTGEQFTAEWNVSGLASGNQQAWYAGGAESLASLQGNTFGVSLIDPVDFYVQTTRSVKYGSLIVLLTFTVFFLVEMMRRLMLHPIQYLLVGLSLVVFFLLLLALSEHMVFGVAYLVAALACVGLVGVYTTSALGGPANGGWITGILGGLYGMLYAILRSEDNALLMGSLLMFAALTAVMLVTRRFDWYGLDRRLGDARGAVEASPKCEG